MTIQENAITLWFAPFRSMSKHTWVPRLLTPEDVVRHCPEEATAPVGEGFRHFRLAMPVVHPGVFPNGAKPLETLLGLDMGTVQRVLCGKERSDDACFIAPIANGVGSQTVRAFTGAELNARDVPSAGNGPTAIHACLAAVQAPASPPFDSFWEVLTEHGKRPLDLMVHTTPIPPITDPASRLADRWEKLWDFNATTARLAAMGAPSLVLDQRALDLQVHYENAFWATLDHLEELVDAGLLVAPD